MSGAGWAGLAGAFGFVGNQISKDAEEQRQEKLKEMEDAATEKRQEFLAGYRSQLQDQNAANRNARGMDRDAAKHDLTSGDVNGAFKDPETGNYFGRTKDGNVIPLNITSDDYQNYLQRQNAGKAVAGDMVGDKTQAQIDRTQAQTQNYNSLTDTRDAKAAQPQLSPEDKQATGYYKSAVQQQFASYNKDKEAAQKAGQDMSKYPAFDFRQAALQSRDQMDTLYGDGTAQRLMGDPNTAQTPVAPIYSDGSAPAGAAPAPTATPRSSRVAPAAAPGAPAPFAEGKMLKGPGGKLYVVRNGVPVPIGGGAPVQQPSGVTSAPQ